MLEIYEYGVWMAQVYGGIGSRNGDTRFRDKWEGFGDGKVSGGFKEMWEKDGETGKIKEGRGRKEEEVVWRSLGRGGGRWVVR